MSPPGVTAIIPVHNGAGWIATAVESVLAQTRPVQECVVVDDGSTDATPDALAGFGRAVRVVRQPRAGVAAARNRGMREARGDAFAFLDCDDAWLPEKLERQLPALAGAGEHAGAYTGYVIVDEALRPQRVVVPRAGDGVERALRIEGPGVGFSFTGMVTRGAAERVGPFDERLSTSADLDFAWRLSRSCRLVGVREPLALYRLTGAAQMHREVGQLERDMASVVERARATGLSPRAVRVARRNVRTYAAFRLLLDGRTGKGLALLGAATIRDPRGPAAMAARAAVQRARQRRALGRLSKPCAPVAPGLASRWACESSNAPPVAT